MGGGGGGWKTVFAQHFFSHWPMFLFTVKAVQDFFFSNLPPPPPPPSPSSKVKWFALYLLSVMLSLKNILITNYFKLHL